MKAPAGAAPVGMALAGLLLACEADRPVELPAPTGPHAIGRVTLHWVDPARPEVMTEDPEDRRELTVNLWYPAAPDRAAAATAPYVADLDGLSPVLDKQSRRAFTLVRTHALEAAPPAAEPAAFPLLLLSPGNDMLSSQYAFLCEELASHGFVVAALDHPYDARAVLLAGGSAVPAGLWPAPPPPDPGGRPNESSPHAVFYRERVGVRSADASFVLDRLAAATEGAAVLARVDSGRVGFLGHSVGGVAAGEICRSDARLAACVNLDGESPGGPFYLEAAGPPQRPYLMMTKTFQVPDQQLAAWNLTRPVWEAMLQARQQRYFGAIAAGSYRVVIDGATHQSFSDDPYVFAALDGQRSANDHRRRLDLIRRHVLAFFGKFLNGQAAPLLDGEEPPPPEVTLQRWPPEPPTPSIRARRGRTEA